MRQGGEEVTQAIRDEIAICQSDAHVHTTRTRCNGRCQDACVVIVYPEGIWYRHVTVEAGREIVRTIVEEKESQTALVSHVYREGVFVRQTEAVVGVKK